MNKYSRILTRYLKVFTCLILVVVLTLFSSIPATALSRGEIREILAGTEFYKAGSDCEVGGNDNVTRLVGNDNITKIFNYFTAPERGLKDFQAAGIMGSMKHESGFEPQRAQGIFDRLVPADRWQEAIGGGWGLVQWTPGSKMIDPTIAAGKDPNDLTVQLDFLWAQMTGTTIDGVANEIKASTDIAQATSIFELKYERHAGGPQPERVVAAQKILDDLKGASGNVYILGDSITARSAVKYKEKIPGATISAVSGRSWTTPGDPSQGASGTQGTAKTAVDTDKVAIAAASTIVIALGTNGLETGNPVDEIITKFKGSDTVEGLNPNAQIYWVNVANGVPGPSIPAYNASLKTKEAAGLIKVIDWAKVVDPDGDGTQNPLKILDDGTHPAIGEVEAVKPKTGVDLLVDLVSGIVSGSTGTISKTDGSSCTCSVATSPNTSTNNSSVVDVELSDSSRADRKVGISVWKPDDPGKYPLIIFAPGRGQNGKADGFYKRYLKAMANSGFVVAALNFVDKDDATAVPTHADDVKFALTSVLADAQFKDSIDTTTGIGLAGHSDGGFVAMIAGYADGKKDDRFKAVMAENGAGYSGFTYTSGPALLGMLGTNDTGNAGAVSGAYASVKTPYSGLAKFKGADHDQYIVSDTSTFKQGVDAVTAGFFKRILKNDTTDLKTVADGYKEILDFESKSDSAPAPANNSESTTETSNSGCKPSGSGNAQGLSATIKAYAWPDYHAAPYVQAMPGWQEVINDAKSNDEFIGGSTYPGIDCGGFVTRALVDSGFLPGYNYGGLKSKGASNTWGGQIPWAKANMEYIGSVTSSSQLQPGDVAFNASGGHTWMFVGKIDGFNSEIASSSFNERAPMAGTEGLTWDGAVWYRKK